MIGRLEFIEWEFSFKVLKAGPYSHKIPIYRRERLASVLKYLLACIMRGKPDCPAPFIEDSFLGSAGLLPYGEDAAMEVLPRTEANKIVVNGIVGEEGAWPVVIEATDEVLSTQPDLVSIV